LQLGFIISLGSHYLSVVNYCPTTKINLGGTAHKRDQKVKFSIYHCKS